VPELLGKTSAKRAIDSEAQPATFTKTPEKTALNPMPTVNSYPPFQLPHLFSFLDVTVV
jgi:hypothetical protein